MSTSTVLANHLQSIAHGVDAIMSDYTEDSVFFTQNGPLKGLAPIRGFFENFLSSSEVIAALTVVRQDVEGEVAYIVWHAMPFVPWATDTLVIRDGKIQSQTFAMLASPPAS